MIIMALVECGTGLVHAIIERVTLARLTRRRRVLPVAARASINGVVLMVLLFVATRFWSL